jgi:adenylate kinase family enzyme
MRIVVIGVSASGKTTFTRKLSEKLSLPTFFADEIQWQPGWQYVGDDAVVTAIQKIIAEEDWIFEGYIANAAREDVFNRADKIIYLDYPGWLSAWRYVKRTLKHRKNPRPELPGSRL